LTSCTPAARGRLGYSWLVTSELLELGTGGERNYIHGNYSSIIDEQHILLLPLCAYIVPLWRVEVALQMGFSLS